MTKQYESIPQVKNLEVDEGTSFTPTPQDDANMVSFNLSWKKLTTFCAVMMGCTVLLVNRQNFGPSIRGGVASSLPSLALPNWGDPDLTCYISFKTVGTYLMSDSGREAEVKVHVLVNGQWKFQDQKKYEFNKDRGSALLSPSTYGTKKIKNSDKVRVFFEEVDDFSSNDWAATNEYGNLCDSICPSDLFCLGRTVDKWHAKWDNGGDVFTAVELYIPLYD